MIAANLKKKFDDLWDASSNTNWVPGRLGWAPAAAVSTLEVSGIPNRVYVSLGVNGDMGQTTAIDAVGVRREAWTYIRMRRENGNLVIREASAYGASSSSGSSNIETAPYRWSTTTTTPPGNSQVRGNNASQNLITNLWVNPVSSDGVDITQIFRLVHTGDRIYIQDTNDSTVYQMYDMTADPTFPTGYIQLPVVWKEGGTALTNNEAITLAVRMFSGGTSPGTGYAPSPHDLDGPHHIGTLSWSKVNKAGSSLGDLTSRDHNQLTNILPDQHHKRSHDIITGDGSPGAVHTVVGNQYSVVGLPANNALGILATSSNPGSTQAIVRTDPTGAVNLGSGLFNVTPANQRISIDGTGLVIDAAADTMVSSFSSTFNASAVFNSNATFNNGVLRFNTDPQSYADYDFMGGDRNITASNSLHIKPKTDLYLESYPTGYDGTLTSTIHRGNVVFPDDQQIRTPTFNSFIAGIEGWNIAWLGGYKHQLTISNILVDNLFAKKFTADEVRVQRGEWFLTRSYGIVETAFTVPAVGATVDVWFEEAPGLGTAKLFLANNWIEFRTIDWGTGLVIQTVWFQAVDADGSGTVDYIQRQNKTATTPSRQQWRLIRRDGGFTGAVIEKGEVGADFGLPTTSMPTGQIGQGVVYASSLYEPDFGPFIEVQIFDSIAGTSPHFLNKVRMGNLQTVVDYTAPAWGFAAGNDLSVLPSSGNFSGVTIDSVQGLRMFNTDISLMSGTIVATKLDRTYGLSLLNDDFQHNHNLRVIAWYDSLDDIPSATATSKMSTWGPIDDRRWTVSTYGRTLANVTLEANGKSGTESAAVALFAGGWDSKIGGVFLVGAQYINLGGNSDIGFPSAHVRIGADSHSYATANLHVFSNENLIDQNIGITMESSLGDSVVHWYLSGGQVMTAGIDKTDNKWKLAAGWSLQTATSGNFIVADPATGQVTVNGLVAGTAITGLIAGSGIQLTGSEIAVNSTVVRTSRVVQGGGGLSGGGTLDNDVTIVINVDTNSGLEVLSGSFQIKDTLAGTGLIMTAGKIMTIDPAQVVNPSTRHIYTDVGSGLQGGGDLSADRHLSIKLGPGSPGLILTGGLAVDGSVARTTQHINTAAGSGLQGGGQFNGDLDLSILLAATAPGLTLTGGLSVDGTVLRNTQLLNTSYPLTGGGQLGSGLTLALILATSSGLGIDTSSHGLMVADSIAGNGLSINNKVLSINPTLFTPTSITLIAGAGLVGGGDLTGNRTFDVGAGLGIQVNANDVQILLNANSGLDISAGLALASSVAGVGLGFTLGVLNVNVSNGIIVGTDSVQIDPLLAGNGLGFTAGVMNVNVSNGIIIGTDSVQIDPLLAGAGLGFTTGVMSVNASGGLIVTADSVQVDPLFAGQGLLITSGVMNILYSNGLTIISDVLQVNQAFSFNWTGLHTFQAGASFHAGVFSFDTNPQINADMDFIGASRTITGSAALTLAPATTLNLSPANNIISMPDATNFRSATFVDTLGSIQGFSLFNTGGTSRQLTISAIKVDNLQATAFTTNLVRLEQGDSYWGRGFGFVSVAFNLPAIGSTVDVWFDNVSNMAGNIFGIGEKLQCRIIIWTTGISLKVIWFNVEQNTPLAVDNTLFRQQWRIKRIDGGADNDPVPAGTVMEDSGVQNDGWIHVTSQKTNNGPYMEFGLQNAYTSGPVTFTQYVRIGQLINTVDFATSAWGLAAGNNLGLNPSAGGTYSGLTLDSVKGMRLFNTAYQLYSGANLVMAIEKAGGISIESTGSAFNTVGWYDDLGSFDPSGNLNLASQQNIGSLGAVKTGSTINLMDIIGTGYVTGGYTSGAVRLRGVNSGGSAYNLWVDSTGVFIGTGAASVNASQTTAFFKDATSYIAGNLGIKNSSPAAALDVGGTVRSTNNQSPASGAGLELLYVPASTTGILQTYDRTGAAYQTTRIEGNPLVLNYASGFNVGIGINPPTQLFHIKKDQAASTIAEIWNANTANGAQAVWQVRADTAFAQIQVLSSGYTAGANNAWLANESHFTAIGGSAVIRTNSAFPIRFVTSNSEAMRVTVKNNLLYYPATESNWGANWGIIEWNQNAIMASTSGGGMYLCGNMYYDGTSWRFKAAASTPGAILSVVNGTMNFISMPPNVAGTAITTSTYIKMVIDHNASYDVDFFTNPRVRGEYLAKNTGTFGATTLTTGSATLSGYISWLRPHADGGAITRSGYMGWHATGILMNLENGADFYIQNGNLGFGSQDVENWASGFIAMEGYRSSIMFRTANSDGIYICDNLYYDSGGWKYKSGGAPMLFQLTGGNGSILAAAAGTIDTAVTFTYVMTWLNNGNVGIENSSPASDLHIGTITPTINVTGGGILVGTNTAQQYMNFKNSGNVESGWLNWTTDVYFGSWSNHAVHIRQNNVDRIFIATSGAVTISNLLTASGGINLGNTTLNDYLESTWSPTITGSVSNPTIGNYNTRVGNHTRIGNMVAFQGHLLIGSTASGGSGDVRISLPIAAAKEGIAYIVYAQGSTIFNSWTYIQSGTAYFTIGSSTATKMQCSALPNTQELLFFGSYFV